MPSQQIQEHIFSSITKYIINIHELTSKFNLLKFKISNM